MKIIPEFMWCITLFVYRIDDVKSDNVVFENAKFNGSLVRNSTFIMFRCELRQRPIGNSVLFQVNFTTVDVITFKNNKCYDKNKECKIEKCLCSNDEYKFQMEYWLERPKAAKSYNFGVEMLLHDNKSNIVTLTLWRCYDGKEFGKIQIGREISRNNVLYNTDENGNSLDNVLGLQRKGRYFQVIFTDLHEETSKATSNVAYKTTKTDATVVDLSFSLEDSIATSDTVLERFSENLISSKESSVPARVKEYCISSATSNVAYKTTKTDATVVDLSFSIEDSIATSDTVIERFIENQISSKESSVPARVNEYAISSDGFELKELKITEEKLSDLKDLEVNNDELQNVDTLQYSTVGFMENTLKKLNAKQIFLEKEVSTVLLHKANEAKFQKIFYEDVSSAVNTLIQKMDLDQENKHIQREVFHIGIVDCPFSFSQFITINEKSSDQYHCTIVNIDRPIRSTTRWISNDAIEKDWYVTSIVCLDAKGDCGFHTTLEDTYVIITDIQEQKTEQFMQLLTFANNTKVMVPMYIGAARCNEGVLRNELKPFVSGRTMYNDQRKTNSLAVDDHIRSFFYSIKELRNRVSKSVFKLLFSLPSLTIAIYEGVKLDKNQIVSRSMQDAAEQKTNCISKMCVRINAWLLPPLGESCKERSQYLKMVYKSSKYKTIQEKVLIRNRMIKARQIMIYLNERWRNILLIEHLDTCKSKWQALKSAQDQKDAAVTIDRLRYQLSEREYDFFGFEHICREMGQMNEALMECNLLTLERSTKNYLELPHTNSKPLIELMDIRKTVLDKLRESIGVTKQLTISVVGIQSSGRSTFLNTMFSCFGFTESKERWKRAPELSREKDNHYNKHATFVIGVDDGTIINMEGENRLRGTCIYAFGKENDNDDAANIWYFGDLWNEILSYRKCVNGDQDALVSDWSMMIRETYPTMTDAILLILKDCVDFSYRNSLESKAYNNMERHCQGLTHTLEKNVLESIRSTLLNTKFSSEFVVITKRCTRAMLMQLVPVLYKTAAYDYVHVKDTRALRAPELSREKNSHYNKHATFVIGVDDGTIINMEGENILRGTDFLLIVFHAIPSLKLVNDRLNLKQKGVYVSPPYAIDKGIQQRKTLVVHLDKVKQEAAGDENIACIYAFGKENDNDDPTNIWYFGDLWNEISSYNKCVNGDQDALVSDWSMMIRETYPTMTDAILLILKDCVDFSFRNSVESKAYNNVERHCKGLTRTLERYALGSIRSTLLNTKFSLEFVLITERCTRSLLMQLVPVLYKTAPYHYVHVKDTRALRAPELPREKNSHYNKHATFVIGVDDGTIINMEGENILRGTDLLLIVFHAIPSLKLVNDRLNLKQKGVYVSPPYAIDKGIQQRKTLVVNLDKVKQEAAGDENIACIYAFGKEIDIYDEANIWYFGNLWNKNPGYSKYLYRVLYFELPMMKKATSFTMADTFSQIFKGDMVFSFRNSLDSKAYNIIERQCQDLSRTLEKYVPEFIMSFVKRNTPKNVISQWTQSKKTSFKLLEQILVSRAKTDIKNTKEALKIQILNIREKMIREIKTYELATYQAANMQGKTQVRDKLEVKIDISWSSWLKRV